MQPTTPSPPRQAGPRVRAPLPAITFPEELPVSARREDIARAIDAHQVVIVCGETGSGKTDAVAEDLPRAGPRRSTA